jgi:hypothetical protein
MDPECESRLHAYLEDHSAGAVGAVGLLEDARKRWKGHEAGGFFAGLLREVEEDRAALEDVLARLGGSPSRLKNAGAAASQKVLALRQRAADDALALLETLEALLLGVRGKRALWTALEDLTDARLAGVDFGALGQRAEDQLGRIERERRAAARAAFLS